MAAMTKEEKAQKRRDKRATKKAEAAAAAAAAAETLAPPPPPAIKVEFTIKRPIENCEIGEIFELDGDNYKVHSREPEYAIVDFLEKSPDGANLIERYQRPVAYGTLVTVPSE